MSETEEIIRWAEENILDVEYQRFPLLRRPSTLAIAHLLKVFGDLLRDSRLQSKADGFRRWRSLANDLGYGLGHCVRWLLAPPAGLVHLPDEDQQTLDNEAMAFLKWGTTYALLANDHTAYSPKIGLLNATADKARREIKFFCSDMDASYLVQQVESQQAAIDERIASMPIELLRNDFEQWCGTVRFRAGFRLESDFGPRPPEVRNALFEWVSANVLPEVSMNYDFGGFLRGDFANAIAAIFPVCQYLAWLEDAADDRIGADNPFGTRPLIMTRATFARWLERTCGLRDEVANALVDVLTFTRTHLHGRVMHQPIIKSLSGDLCLLPRLILLVHLERILVGALHATGHKDVYDAISSTIAKRHVSSIGVLLSGKPGWECVTDQQFRARGKTVKPDFVVWERATNRALVAEYKNALEPHGVGDVHNKLGERDGWLEKMRAYIEFFRNNPSVLCSRFHDMSPDKLPTLDGLVVTRWPLPLPTRPEETFPIIDLTPVERSLRGREEVSIGTLLDLARRRPDVERPRKLKTVEQSFRVGEWTYRREIFASDESV